MHVLVRCANNHIKAYATTIYMIRNLSELSEYKTIITSDGHKMRVNPFDMYISRDLANWGHWEPHIRNVLQERCKAGMNFMDIGANIGAHTLFMSKLVGPTGRGFAFEPCNSHSSILFYNLMTNNCFNTTVYQYGCSDVEETMYVEERFTLTKKQDNYGGITLQTTKSENNDEPIQTRVLDNMNLPRIDIVKIDAEGMEERVINGMRGIIERDKPVFILEIHSSCEERMFALLFSIGYMVSRIENSWDFLAYSLIN
jgi:FkbM family methyltransferase